MPDPNVFEPMDVPSDPSDKRFMFFCPGCKCGHFVRIAGPEPVWQFDGNLVAPTVSPSLLIRSGRMDGKTYVPTICHSFITAGWIRFLSDCTHALVDKTVALEPFT